MTTKQQTDEEILGRMHAELVDMIQGNKLEEDDAEDYLLHLFGGLLDAMAQKKLKDDTGEFAIEMFTLAAKEAKETKE